MKIVLHIHPAHFAIAEEMAKDHGYARPEHYLNHVLTAAVLNDRDDKYLRDESIERSSIEDDAGFVADLNDDIPF
jgi:hypothetical protein